MVIWRLILSSSRITTGALCIIHVATGDHFACILPVPFLAKSWKLSYWNFPSFMMVIGSSGSPDLLSTNFTGTTERSSLLGWIWLEVHSMMFSLGFVTTRSNITAHFSQFPWRQEHWFKYIYWSTSTLTRGISPHLWAKNSSCKAEVFSLISTISIAIVGTSEIMILLRAFAIVRSVLQSSKEQVLWSMFKIFI